MADRKIERSDGRLNVMSREQNEQFPVPFGQRPGARPEHHRELLKLLREIQNELETCPARLPGHRSHGHTREAAGLDMNIFCYLARGTSE